nr:hypothetical protein [Tanacetum cinerariifolium]
MLQICPNRPGQKFVDPLFEEEILAFIKKLGYSGNMKTLSDAKVETLPQPWRKFRTIINKCLSGKVSRNDLLHLSRAQILWGMYYQKNVHHVYLLWEDLVYQIENKEAKKNKDMYYPRFTKVIINHFMSKDQSIPRRNKVEWHMANDDPILTTMRSIPKHETAQKYGAILPDAYKTYYDFATRKVIPTPKYVRRSTREKTDQAPIASTGKRLKATAKVAKSRKKKLPAKGLENLSEVALSETESDNDGDDFFHPKLSTFDEEERHEEKLDEEEEGSDQRFHTPSHFESTDDEVTQGDNAEEEKLDEEKTNEEEEVNELYNDVNINLEGIDTKMRDALLANVQATQVIEDTHVIITTVTPEVQQQSSSVSSGFISNMLNPNPNTEILLHLKRHRDDEDEDEEPSTGLNRGSKRRRSGKELESTSAPKEKNSKSTGSYKEGSKSKTSQHPDWFKKLAKPPNPDRDWNKTLPTVYGPIQPWISTFVIPR